MSNVDRGQVPGEVQEATDTDGEGAMTPGENLERVVPEAKNAAGADHHDLSTKRQGTGYIQTDEIVDIFCRRFQSIHDQGSSREAK